ncbi:hypothetical protein [Mucilaginibacter ginsenosidivorax]|uniref:Dialkylresorcinol condensing enzyme DarA n=1 Tax=Mucilaginibacter ginsenosidivorax TaxID=862126 RepID=A0A5B8VZG3_9SPHI|nr:hypothetical protein [Mucilaginibacter ginsenosidivorax]QEC76731.1 hypothetical protein FSB76_12505 [Mucilaginibacter ginsenosidivorax]
MSKKILAIYYTQSGQMRDVIDSLTQPIIDTGASVEKVEIKMVNSYNFPWTGSSFFAVMPDCVLGVPAQIEPFTLKETKYDMVIVGYQPWFLSPSIPSNSILNHPDFIKVVQDTPVVTISAARNMWLNAFVRVRKSIQDAGGRLVGNIALVDRHLNPISFVTIFYWMLTGKKESYLNIFPKPGVDEQEIKETAKFGRVIAARLNMVDYWDSLQYELMLDGAVNIKYPLMFIEGKAKIIFSVWAKIISKRKNKAAWLAAFKYYLFFALFIVAPIALTVDMILIRPFFGDRIQEKKNFYLQLN